MKLRKFVRMGLTLLTIYCITGCGSVDTVSKNNKKVENQKVSADEIVKKIKFTPESIENLSLDSTIGIKLGMSIDLDKGAEISNEDIKDLMDILGIENKNDANVFFDINTRFQCNENMYKLYVEYDMDALGEADKDKMEVYLDNSSKDNTVLYMYTGETGWSKMSLGGYLGTYLEQFSKSYEEVQKSSKKKVDSGELISNSEIISEDDKEYKLKLKVDFSEFYQLLEEEIATDEYKEVADKIKDVEFIVTVDKETSRVTSFDIDFKNVILNALNNETDVKNIEDVIDIREAKLYLESNYDSETIEIPEEALNAEDALSGLGNIGDIGGFGLDENDFDIELDTGNLDKYFDHEDIDFGDLDFGMDLSGIDTSNIDF